MKGQACDYPSLRTPADWARHTGIRVIDPDGWRAKFRDRLGELEPRSWNDPITKEEFQRRAIVSTISSIGRCVR